MKTWKTNARRTVQLIWYRWINFIKLVVHQNISTSMLYFDAVGWVFWPVKPTTESENQLQLHSLSTSVNIDRLTMVDNTSAVGNDSRPRVVPQLINGCQLPWGRDGSFPIQSLVEFLIFSGHLCSPIQAVPDWLVITTTTTTTTTTTSWSSWFLAIMVVGGIWSLFVGCCGHHCRTPSVCRPR